MKYITSLILLFFFIKSFYYGIYEIKNNKNKSGGLTILFLAFLGLAFPVFILFTFY